MYVAQYDSCLCRSSNRNTPLLKVYHNCHNLLFGGMQWLLITKAVREWESFCTPFFAGTDGQIKLFLMKAKVHKRRNQVRYSIVCDNRDKKNRKLLEIVKVRHCISSPYHPQTDERMNQTLSRMLVKLANEEKEDWDLHIDSALYANRVSRHHSTKYTLFS